MPLTREQFQVLRDKGLSVDQIISFEKGETPKTLQSQKQTEQIISSNQFQTEQPKSFLEKARDFTVGLIGGGKLAQGAGQAIAAPEVQAGLTKEQDDTFALQQKLLQAIRTKTANGEDTTRLKNALKQSQNLSQILSDAHQDFISSLPTNKEIIGSSLRLAGSAAGGYLTKTIAKGLALGKATGFVQGALRGAGVGAITGGIEGGIQGTGLGLEANQSSEEIIKSGLLGGISGALIGGAVGSITGGIVGSLKQRAINKENFVKELVSPIQSKEERIAQIRQGKFKDPTFLQKAELDYSKQDEQLADAVKDIIKPKATISQNINAMNAKVDELNKGVTDYIAKNKIPINMKQVRSALEKGKENLKLIFVSDMTAEKTYNAVADAFMNEVKQGDTLGVFKARQTLDKIPAITKLLENDKLGENARREIVKAVRNAANEYVAELLPTNNPYKSTLLQETRILEASGNLAEKADKLLGQNNIQIMTQKYPILKWLVGGIATGLAGGAGIGVGSSIIGSTE